MVLSNKITDIANFENALRVGLNQKDFHFMYQPIISTKGKGVALEMLVRWKFEGEWVSPVMFIPVLERLQLISVLNRLLVDQLVKDREKLAEKIPELTFLSLNISPYIFKYKEEEGFLEYLLAQLKAHDMEPQHICLEITESSMLTQQAKEFLNDCRRLGFLIAIDDFGTGFSSMSYLVDRSFNVLKMDRSLIHQIMTNPRQYIIAEALVHLSANLDVRLVAEGVETYEQYALLQKLGVDDIQGFYLGKPMFIDDMVSLPMVEKTNEYRNK